MSDGCVPKYDKLTNEHDLLDVRRICEIMVKVNYKSLELLNQVRKGVIYEDDYRDDMATLLQNAAYGIRGNQT